MKFLTPAAEAAQHHTATADHYRTVEGKEDLARMGRFLELVFVADESEADGLIQIYR